MAQALAHNVESERTLKAVRSTAMLCEAKSEGANGYVPEQCHLRQRHLAGHDQRQCRCLSAKTLPVH